MYRYLTLALVMVFMGIFGCSSEDNPLSPVIRDQNLRENGGEVSQTNLWGYYDVYFDFQEKTVTPVVNRQVMFTANVVNFLNSKPSTLKFKINSTPIGADYIDVDIDVEITHPFPGMPQYNGYDVRGIFMGNGSGVLSYDSDLVYPIKGIDQSMFSDPVDGYGGPDGYTRWFNKAEFSVGGMPLFSYTPGVFATKNFSGNATLNPYKYFADTLNVNENAFDWIKNHPTYHGQFSSGATNSRNYYLRFPTPSPNVVYGYAVIANWEGPDQNSHPSNATEAVACSVDDTSKVYYVNPSTNGGFLNLEFSLLIWEHLPSAIIIESSVLSNPYVLSASELIPSGGGENYSTWSVEIPTNNVKGVSGNEYFIIAEYDAFDYKNEFNTPNLAEGPLRAYFRYDLSVSPTPFSELPVCNLSVVTPMPASGVGSVPVEFSASGSYDPEGFPLNYEWDFDGDNIYNEIPDDDYSGSLENPIHTYTSNYSGKVNLRLTDVDGGVSICSTENLSVSVLEQCPNTNVPSGVPNPIINIPYGHASSAGVTTVKGASGQEYLIGHTRDYYGQRYGFYAINGNGTVVHNYMSPAQPNYPPTTWGLAGTKSGRVYVCVITQYIYSSDLIYFVDFDETTGFSGLLQQASFPSIAPFEFTKITVDENDRLVGLAYQGNNLVIKRWNGSSWDTIDIQDDAGIYAGTGFYGNGIQDFAWNPASETYWITNRYHGYTPNYDGVPSVWVINSDGTTSWWDDDIYPSAPLNSQYSVGVHVDVNDPDCRTLLLICCGYTGVNTFVSRMIRYDAYGNVTGAGYMGDTPRYIMAHGSVFKWNNTYFYGGSTDFSGQGVGLVTVPDW